MPIRRYARDINAPSGPGATRQASAANPGSRRRFLDRVLNQSVEHRPVGQCLAQWRDGSHRNCLSFNSSSAAPSTIPAQVAAKWLHRCCVPSRDHGEPNRSASIDRIRLDGNFSHRRHQVGTYPRVSNAPVGRRARNKFRGGQPAGRRGGVTWESSVA